MPTYYFWKNSKNDVIFITKYYLMLDRMGLQRMEVNQYVKNAQHDCAIKSPFALKMKRDQWLLWWEKPLILRVD